MKLFSTGGSHVAKNNRSGKKATALIIAIALILVAAVGGTLAVLKANTGSVINSFTAGKSDINIEEKISGNEKTEIAVKNDGTATVYVRVALVANMIDEDGNVTAGASVPEFNLNSAWIKGADGYYYYTKPLDGGVKTANLLASNMVLAEGMQVTVLAESIQSSPASAAETAWGVTVNADGTIAK